MSAAFGGNEAQVEAVSATAAAAPTHAVAAAAQPRDSKGRVQTKPVADDGNERAPARPRGNAQPYLTARIARDAPEVHEGP